DVRADVVAEDLVARPAEDQDAVDPVARDHVPGRGSRPTDEVIRRADDNRIVDRQRLPPAVGPGQGTRDVGADVIALDRVTSARGDPYRGVPEAVDDEAPDGGTAGGDRQTVRRCAGTRAIDFDLWGAAESGLGG